MIIINKRSWLPYLTHYKSLSLSQAVVAHTFGDLQTEFEDSQGCSVETLVLGQSGGEGIFNVTVKDGLCSSHSRNGKEEGFTSH